MDNLDHAQFDLLVRVLSCPSWERDFKLLLSPVDIQEVVDNLKEFGP